MKQENKTKICDQCGEYFFPVAGEVKCIECKRKKWLEKKARNNVMAKERYRRKLKMRKMIAK